MRHIWYVIVIIRRKKQEVIHLKTYPTTFVAAASCAHAIILDGMPYLKKKMFSW